MCLFGRDVLPALDVEIRLAPEGKISYGNKWDKGKNERLYKQK